jgi:DNA-binding response OmpR family regulator
MRSGFPHLGGALRWQPAGVRTDNGSMDVTTSTEEALQSSTARILVVDDDPLVVRIITHALRALGRCEGLTDPKGVEAHALQMAPDCVLCDVMMPGRSGLELVRSFKADPRLRHIPFALLTGKTDRGDVLAGLEAGADDYIPKPVDPEILRSKVRVLIRLRHLQAELARTARLRMLAETAVALNHEINNPLMGLMCTLEMLQYEAADLDLPPRLKQRLDDLGDMALRIQDVVRKLSNMDEVRTREYLPGVAMLDLG